MKIAMQIAAVFMFPLMIFFWAYALGRMAIYLWDCLPATAFVFAAIVTVIQFLFVYSAIESGLISDEPGEKE
jgi:hypothetical protein